MGTMVNKRQKGSPTRNRDKYCFFYRKHDLLESRMEKGQKKKKLLT